jgi:hypothetical protein
LTIVNRSCVSRCCHVWPLCRAAGIVQWTDVQLLGPHADRGIAPTAPAATGVHRHCRVRYVGAEVPGASPAPPAMSRG